MAAASVLASRKQTTPNVAPTSEPAASVPVDAQAVSDELIAITLQLNSADSGVDVQKTTMASAPPRESVEPKGSGPLGLREKLRKTALGFLGTPYRWGGTTPKAFDCSGFTRYLYAKFGIKLPRPARQQYKAGQVVKAGHWKPGDLLFFDMAKGYVSHVGMYIGNNKFVHAANPRRGVRVDSLSTKSYKNTYVGARRFSS